MAGMPTPIVLRANEIMHHLEKDKIQNKNQEKIKDIPKEKFQLQLFEAGNPNFEKAKDMLESLDINTISPVEALLKLHEIKMLLAEKEEASKKL
jgi:DNA mismatch repair protein MutS